MIKYGLISEVDARCLEKTIDLIFDGFPELKSTDFISESPIMITEVGLFDCGTANGVLNYLSTKCSVIYTGIDNEKDKPINAPEWLNYIKGNADEVVYKIPDESQHLIFVDGCHCFAHVVSDFFCYASKIKAGGYFAFHDTGSHIKPFKDFQHGDKENPDAYISVRKALESIGLIWKNGSNEFIDRYAEEWELIFDEADPNDEAGGLTVFKRLY